MVPSAMREGIDCATSSRWATIDKTLFYDILSLDQMIRIDRIFKSDDDILHEVVISVLFIFKSLINVHLTCGFHVVAAKNARLK